MLILPLYRPIIKQFRRIIINNGVFIASQSFALPRLFVRKDLWRRVFDGRSGWDHLGEVLVWGARIRHRTSLGMLGITRMRVDR